MNITPTMLIWIGAYLGAVICALMVAWLFRRVSSQPNDPLDRLGRAFLIGGPYRAREVAFFQLATESWIKPTPSGDFAPRVFAVDEDVIGLLPLEREMLSWAIKQIKFSPTRMIKRTYKKLQDVEKQLVRNRLILSSKAFLDAKIVALLPLGILTIYTLVQVGMNFRLHVHEPHWVIFAVIGMATILHFANDSHRSTSLGKTQRDLIIRETRLRIQQSSRATDDGNPSTYDLLWKMGDQVLLGGLRALGGTAFMKPMGVSADDTKTTVL